MTSELDAVLRRKKGASILSSLTSTQFFARRLSC